MQGTYDTTLVIFSILIAMLAAYVAIEFAGRILERQEQRGRWLWAGALAMGSGVWAMHFVGMAALTLPIPIRYDLAITLFSWLAAVAVSGLALWLVSRGPLSARSVGAGALAMGAGICVMHYAGMGAMRMDPGLGYDPLWFGVSVLIAVGASAAALVIVAALRKVRSWRDVGLRAAAAVVMGLAIAGMHYSGMAAVQFDANAFCAPGNVLDGGLIATPTILASLAGLGFAIFFTVADARAVLAVQRAAREEAERLDLLAFRDRETGLFNRARFSQILAEALRRQARLSLVCVRVAAESQPGGRERLPEVARALAALEAQGFTVARTSPDQLVVLVSERGASDVIRQLLPDWRRRVEALRATGLLVRFGVAESPADGDNGPMLMLRAASRTNEDLAAPESLPALRGYQAPPSARSDAAA